ncbi:MAG: transglycosylase SLT domain-containing protein, partial [Proteobacteria bacterium]|nr:transglycosylase SLT domain-containing protein [Pseudomonadota bacterium]
MLCSLGYINIKFLSYTFADQLVFRGAILASIAFIGGCAAVGDTPATAIPSTANELEIAVVQNVEDASLLPAMTKDVKASADNTPQLDEVERANKTEAREPEIIFDTSLWTVMRPLMTLDHQTDEKRVGQQLRWLQKHPEYWERLAPRMQRYLPYILHEVSVRNLPAELALLPVIESALDPYAFSPYGASGLWQFMRPTAKQYGLQMNRHYDGRRDVIASTQAALDFLEDLHRRFDDWSLALAAYNSGGGTVSKAVRKGRTRDFFALRLPRETKAYVPRLLAISAIVADPEAFGIELPAIENIDPLREVALPSPYDVAVVANVLSIEVSEIYEYNPALR